jgi:hypothetical protein
MRTLEKEINEETKGIKKEAYIRHQKASGFKAGDRVKVLRSSYYMELGWNECWMELKDKFIGKVFTIVNVEPTGITLKYDKDDEYAWHFPFFILKRAFTPTIEFLMPDETWKESACREDDIKDFTLVTNTNEYGYYHDGETILYRVERQQSE